MTGKPPDDALMNEQQLRTTADTIPSVICQFYEGRAGKRGPGWTMAGTTGSSDSIIVNDGSVPDANPEYHSLTGNRTMEEILRERVAEWTTGYGDEKNAGLSFFNAGIIQNPEGT
ncbi:MAG: hypothetical protein WC593_01795 [Methanoregula sp.]